MKKNIIVAIIIISTFFFFFWYLVASSFYDQSVDSKKEFVTDGCTLFMDSTWKACCVQHDKSYWSSGSFQERLEADEKFKNCVYEKSNQKLIAQVMYGTVRISGVPYLATPWRWGYGWKFGRGYN